MNKVLLTGVLVHSEMKYLAGGIPILTLAIEAKKPIWENGGWVDSKEVHEVKCFGKLASQYEHVLRRGNRVDITGELQSRKWKGKQGEEFSSLSVKVTELESFSSGGPLSGDTEAGLPTSQPEDEIPF